MTDKNTFAFPDGLSASVVSHINRSARTHSFSKGETIVRKGQKIGGAYLVKSGVLRVYTIDSNGNEKPVYTLRQGEICIFSITCVFKKIAYPAWVSIASPKATVISIPTAAFRHLYETESAVKDYVFNSMSQRVFDLMTSIEEIALYDVGHRINSFLVRSCSNNRVLLMSHQEIATILGTAREVVSRHLKELERNGYIVLSRMKIEILLPEQLASIPPE